MFKSPLFQHSSIPSVLFKSTLEYSLKQLDELNKIKPYVLIAGGSGYIGRKLAAYLSENGYTVSILSRKNSAQIPYQTYLWNPDSGSIDPRALADKDIIINLAGTGLADKFWTNKRKKEIYDSRLLATRLIVETIKLQNLKPKAIFSASAIGFYGNRPAEKLSESSPPGKGFLADVCKVWEKEAISLKHPSSRVIILRIGITVDPENGIIKKLKQSLKFRLNLIPGNGKQLISWIHIEDLCRTIAFLIENKNIEGIVNCVSPQPVSFSELQKLLAEKKGIKCLSVLIPSIFIKTFLGSFSELFLMDQQVIPEKLIEGKFIFSHPDIDSAL